MLKIILLCLIVSLLTGRHPSERDRTALENYFAASMDDLGYCIDGAQVATSDGEFARFAVSVMDIVCNDGRVGEGELFDMIARLEHRVVYLPITLTP